MNYNFQTRKKLTDDFMEQWQKGLEALSKDSKRQGNELEQSNSYYHSYSNLTKEARNISIKENITKLSVLMKKHYKELVNLYVREKDREDYYYIIDKLNQFPYSHGMYRRTVRTKAYFPNMENLFTLLKDYRTFQFYDCTMEDYLLDKLPEEKLDYKRNKYYSSDFTFRHSDDLLAARIDKGDKGVIEAIKDIILGETNTAIVTTQMIRGIVKSSDSELHKLLADFLLAARLSEGVRQAICENADCGTIEAFITLFDTIYENNLIRFSAIKRAIATWTGICNLEQVDRISNKMLELIKDSIHNKEIAKEYLKTNDSIKISIGLWTLGAYEVQDALDAMESYIENGTKNQILTMSYFNRTLKWGQYEKVTAKQIVAKYPEDLEIIGAFMPTYLSETAECVQEILDGPENRNKKVKTYKEIPLTRMFKDEEEARNHYYILQQVLHKMDKKNIEFSPCIFPWYSVSISKSDLIQRMCLIAWFLKNSSYIEEMAEMLSLLETKSYYNSRDSYLELLLSKPVNQKQKELVLNYIVDKESATRAAAYQILDGLSLSNCDYLRLEGFLKYKRGDIRRNVLTLLGKQDDKSLLESVKRLLLNKKEEIREGGLSLIIEAKRDGRDKEVIKKLTSQVEKLKNVSDKQQILIDEILEEKEKQEEEGYGFYNPSFTPTYPECSIDEKKRKAFFKITKKELDHLFQKMNDFIKENAELTYTNSEGDEILLGNSLEYTTHDTVSLADKYPFKELFIKFYEQEIKDARILTLLHLAWIGNCFIRQGKIINEKQLDYWKKKLIGSTLCEYYVPAYPYTSSGYQSIVYKVLTILEDIYKDDKIREIALELAHIIGEKIPQEDLWYKIEDDGPSYYNSYNREEMNALTDIPILRNIINRLLQWKTDDEFKECFFALYQLDQKFKYNDFKNTYGLYRFKRSTSNSWLNIYHYVKAWIMDIISEEAVYQAAFEIIGLSNTLVDLSRLFQDSLNMHDKNYLELSLKQFLTEEELKKDLRHLNQPFVAACKEIYFRLTNKILDIELKRGEMETEFTNCVFSISRIYGIQRLIELLKALGNEKLNRSSYYWLNKQIGRRESFSYLLQHCYPEDEETAQELKQQISGTNIKEQRIIEIAMYAPQWISIIEDYLGWSGFKSGCYYFMAHMNEYFDDKKKAIIARYTPFTCEELNLGAFDIVWFNEAYKTLGKERFDKLYDGAKYISDGSKHGRARKYADAVMGKVTVKELESLIHEKRNKDILMSYGLIPIKNQKDMIHRYEFIQEFLKESKQYGSQRRASEASAVSMALKNLANNAGYADVTRLALAMESQLIKTYGQYFNNHTIDDVTIKLITDEYGQTKVICERAGKRLKSIPAKIKKDKYIMKLKEVEKKLKEQYKRTVKMLEQSMEEREKYQFGELLLLCENPVIEPVIRSLVFITANEASIHGFFGKTGLINCFGEENKLKKNSLVRIVHPIDLYQIDCWHEYQKNLFKCNQEGNIKKQPFKQIFRELYMKLPEELEKKQSAMFAGNQIQPAKTTACLKKRRWIADYEEGLQKIYYKDNLIAHIYAMADWFSPADIEAPTLEWVQFSDRKTFQPIKLNDVPDIIYSEVMRDVDMVVSVAHAGGVDPETSHSTIEMRKSILEFALPLFHISNVRLEGSYAHIKGEKGNYNIHLGSGMIHQLGGPPIQVLPIHSQGRGKLFLPFLDEDPKTAEIISKIILFAEDKKIKDPYILSQIQY